jgi:hypothetical protein
MGPLAQYIYVTAEQSRRSQASAGAHSLEAWRWAWSCVHSRSFKDSSGGHLIVPGIDMANHAFAPSATVRSAHVRA